MSDPIAAILVSGAVGFATWMMRRCLIKYERALIAAEIARRKLVESELENMKMMVTDLKMAGFNQTKDRAALTQFLSSWAKQLDDRMTDRLRFYGKDVDELRATLDGLVKFFNVAKSTQVTTATEIAKDVFLLHKVDPPKGK